ncbi:MAG: hypothetical protein ACJ72N_27420 [Labedaea sp.]
MATAKAKNTYVSINGTDISAYCDSSEHHVKPDIVDKTTYGKNSHVKEGTLLDGSGSIGGIYDTSAVAGPRAILQPLVGQTVTYVRRVEGTGSGKPQDSVSVVVGEYVETSPVAEIVRWTCALEYSDDIDSTPQP